MLCITGTENTSELTIKRVNKFANYLNEIRLDFLQNKQEIKNIINWQFSPLITPPSASATPPPNKPPLQNKLIFTLRTKKQGGLFNGTQFEFNKIITNILSNSSHIIDIDFFSFNEISKEKIEKLKDRIILSYHNFKDIPENIVEIISKMEKENTKMLKVALNVNSTNDLFKVFKLKNCTKKPLVLIAMGKYGQLSRIFYKQFGSPYTYVAGGDKTADYQLSMQEGRLYCNDSTKIYGLIGNESVFYSPGPAYYNKLFQENKLNYVYVPFCTDSPTLSIEFANILGFNGLSVTSPFKEKVAHLITNKNNINAINTLKFQESKILGFNSDGIGAVIALQEVINPTNKRIAILGTGGSALALIIELLKLTTNITVYYRNSEKAHNIKDQFGVSIKKMDLLDANDFDIFINATPIGSSVCENNMILIKNSKSLFNKVVMDITLGNDLTPLLNFSKKMGAKIINGKQMWFHQGLKQLEFWFNKNSFKNLKIDRASV